MNELTARDIDDDSSDDYTLLYNTRGDLTDDGENYEYEYDAFGRLTEISDQSQNTVAEYTYNGLGYRTSVKYDTDTDGDVDANDQTYHHAYDTKWRIVATYRGTDANPKEQFTHHNAGLSGGGGSSYIDAVICRDKDANTDWTVASDGTLEERIYYCQDYKSDVVALVTDDGKMLEWVQYSAYGVPFGLPAGDTNSDGDCDMGDLGQMLSWIGQSTYDIRGDLDLDGDVDSTDSSIMSANFVGVTLGRGVLSNSDVQNFFGYTGHRHDEAIPTSVHARHRVLLTELGRWTRRDPLGYVDGMNLYQYTRSRPLVTVDLSGLTQTCCEAMLDGLLNMGDPLIDSARHRATISCNMIGYLVDIKCCTGADGLGCADNVCGITITPPPALTMTVCICDTTADCHNCQGSPLNFPMRNILRHELIHADDLCWWAFLDQLANGTINWNRFVYQDKLCTEIRAWTNDGGPHPCTGGTKTACCDYLCNTPQYGGLGYAGRWGISVDECKRTCVAAFAACSLPLPTNAPGPPASVDFRSP